MDGATIPEFSVSRFIRTISLELENRRFSKRS